MSLDEDRVLEIPTAPLDVDPIEIYRGRWDDGGGATDVDGKITVTRNEAADWIIRSALPRILELLTLGTDAAYFYGLEPLNGYTPTGRLRGWNGAGVRLAAAEESVSAAYRNLLSVRSQFTPVEMSFAEIEGRRACVFARQIMLPSRLGWNAYRVIARSSRLAHYAAEAAGDSTELIDLAWCDVLDALADRALLRQHN